MPHGHRLRGGRYSRAGHYYVVTTRTLDSRPVFDDLHAGRIVARTIAQHERTETVAFVVMPDHAHWLFELIDGTLADVVRHFKGASARKVNAHLRTSGALWQRGYFEHCVRGEESLIRHARYIVANPLRAGLIERIEDYPLWDAYWL